jgi:hypothetical protein
MKNLIKSLSNFQNECPVIHKDTKGHNYTYADLTQIHSIINPILKKHGLCIVQPLDFKIMENNINEGIRTILFHVESGESLESFTTIPKIKLGIMNEYQSFGSGVTYYRRYALSSMLGLITDKDLDACGIQEVKIPQAEAKSLQMWKQEIDKCKSVEDLNSYYANSQQSINGNKDIISLFSTKKLSFTINQ